MFGNSNTSIIQIFYRVDIFSYYLPIIIYYIMPKEICVVTQIPKVELFKYYIECIYFPIILLFIFNIYYLLNINL